jgi:hypothetical protein
MAIRKIKISVLPLAQSLIGLFTIGVDAAGESVKVALQFLKDAADSAITSATSANNAASTANTAAAAANQAREAANAAAASANTAATNANTAKDAANTAAAAANTAKDAANAAATAATTAKNAANAAANNANQQAEAAYDTIVRMEDLADSLVAQYKAIPTAIELDYPKMVTYRNTVMGRIGYTLLPTNTGRNVLFLGDNNAVTVMPDGGFIINKPGVSRIFVIPTENTNIYKTIEITVAIPGLRKVKANALRFMGNGNLRLT